MPGTATANTEVETLFERSRLQLTNDQMVELYAMRETLNALRNQAAAEYAELFPRMERLNKKKARLQDYAEVFAQVNLTHLQVPLIRTPAPSRFPNVLAEAVRGGQTRYSSLQGALLAQHEADHGGSTQTWNTTLPGYGTPVQTYLRRVYLQNQRGASWYIPGKFQWEVAEAICRDFAARELLPEGMTFGSDTL